MRSSIVDRSAPLDIVESPRFPGETNRFPQLAPCGCAELPSGTGSKSGWEPEFDRSRGDLSVDLVRRIVRVADKHVKLSPKEYELLRVLVQHAGKVLTHRFLLKELCDELTDAQYLRVYVRQLRQKIEADPERPQIVLTETGIGYRLRAGD